MGLAMIGRVRGAVCLAVALGALAAVTAAQAQAGDRASSATPSAKDAREARRLFNEAMERLRVGDFTAARDQLLESVALAPNPGSGFNLGLAYRGTGQMLRAAETFADVIAGKYGAIRSEQRREVQAMLNGVRADIARVKVEVQGAPFVTLRIDGVVVEESLAEGGVHEQSVDPGAHVLTASAADYEDAEERVEVARGAARSVTLSLRPTKEARTGVLVVEGASDDDQLRIEGVASGRGRLERTVPPGKYHVELESPAGSRDAWVVVKPRSTVRYRFDVVDNTTVWESPFFWGAVGVGTAAIVVGAVLLFGTSQGDPLRDDVYGVTEALR